MLIKIKIMFFVQIMVNYIYNVRTRLKNKSNCNEFLANQETVSISR